MKASICDASLALCWFNTAAWSRMSLCDVGEGCVGDVVGLDEVVEDGQKIYLKKVSRSALLHCNLDSLFSARVEYVKSPNVSLLKLCLVVVLLVGVLVFS